MKETIAFLKKLDKNNNREWFAEHKPKYQNVKLYMEDFLQSVFEGLSKSDVIERKNLWRIYRDIRFSKDKTPYNIHFGASLVRAGVKRRGGYCFCIGPGSTWVGGGFYNPHKEDLLLIRKEFEYDGKTIRKIMARKKFKDTFGEMQGTELKTAPRGFDKQDPNIDLIRKKNFYFHRNFTDAEVCAPSFLKETVKTFENIRPFFDYMSVVLTEHLDEGQD